MDSIIVWGVWSMIALSIGLNYLKMKSDIKKYTREFEQRKHATCPYDDLPADRLETLRDGHPL